MGTRGTQSGSRGKADTGSVEAAGVAVERERNIAMAAYFKAEARGFEPGGEMDDWLTAEAEYEAANGGRK